MKKISPMLATLVEASFDDKEWIFEIKWDGYRALGTKKELISRNQKSYNERFPTIFHELQKLPGEFLLDGEIVLLDKAGRASFQLLQNYYTRKEGTPYYYVFDLLSLNGKDLTQKPLLERKELLKNLLHGVKHIRYNDYVKEKGKAFFKAATKKGLEGIIAKKMDSPYQFGRSRNWLKIKTKMRQEVVIGGFTEPKGSRKKFGALIIGVYQGDQLHYVGHVGGGFNQKLLSDIYTNLQKITRATSPFVSYPFSTDDVTWVKPKLVCEVEFSEWTEERRLRMPIFKGMRYDKPPKKVVRE